MGAWNNWVYTDSGRELIAKHLAGSATLCIRSVKVTDKDYSKETLTALTALSGDVRNYGILSYRTISNSQVQIECNVTNVGLTADYTFPTIAVFASDGEEGDEVLLAVCTARTPETLPALYNNNVVKTITIRLILTISNAEQVVAQLDMSVYVTRSECINTILRKGTVIMTDGSYNPADVWGGTWEQIKGKYLMASGTYCGVEYKAMTVVGEEYHQISYAEMPAHGHTRGSMNITGSFWADDSVFNSWYGPLEGAFEKGRRIGRGDHDSGGGGYDSGQISFNAKNSWTGTTSIEGKNQPMPMQPRAIVVDVWRRR